MSCRSLLAQEWIENIFRGVVSREPVRSRERGLKLLQGVLQLSVALAQSGLKLLHRGWPNCYVAPRAGAWIETNLVVGVGGLSLLARAWTKLFFCLFSLTVALAGAWIETCAGKTASAASLLAQERGLKLFPSVIDDLRSLLAQERS